jgi:hypothetical protein
MDYDWIKKLNLIDHKLGIQICNGSALALVR